MIGTGIGYLLRDFRGGTGLGGDVLAFELGVEEAAGNAFVSRRQVERAQLVDNVLRLHGSAGLRDSLRSRLCCLYDALGDGDAVGLW